MVGVKAEVSVMYMYHQSQDDWADKGKAQKDVWVTVTMYKLARTGSKTEVPAEMDDVSQELRTTFMGTVHEVSRERTQMGAGWHTETVSRQTKSVKGLRWDHFEHGICVRSASNP